MSNYVDPDPKTIRFPCIRAEQPVGDIYVAVMDSQMLGDVTFFDVRRVLQEERDFERYLGIQRPLDPKRVDALMRYVNLFDATFPTSIIIAMEQDYVRYDEEKKK